MSSCSCRLKFNKEIELDGVYYEVEGTVYGSHYHLDGCMWRSNGDPGYPPEDEIEIEDFEIDDCYDENNPDEDLPDDIVQKLYEELDDIEWEYEDGWEDSCSCDG